LAVTRFAVSPGEEYCVRARRVVYCSISHLAYIFIHAGLLAVANRIDIILTFSSSA